MKTMYHLLRVKVYSGIRKQLENRRNAEVRPPPRGGISVGDGLRHRSSRIFCGCAGTFYIRPLSFAFLSRGRGSC